MDRSELRPSQTPTNQPSLTISSASDFFLVWMIQTVMGFVWINPNFVGLYPNSIQTGGVVQFFALAHFIPSMSSSLEPASYFLIYKFEGDFQLEWDISWFSTKMRHFEERNSDEMCFRGNVGQIQPTKETSLETSHLTLKLSKWTLNKHTQHSSKYIIERC